LPGLPATQLELLRMMVPGLERLAVLVEAAALSSVVISDQVRQACDALGIQVERFDLRFTEDLDTAFEAAMLWQADAVFNAANTLLQPARGQLAELGRRHRVPMYGNRAYAEAGLLMAYAVDQTAVASRAAAYVDKILKGAKPADVPVEQPSIFEFVVNLTTAQAIGITVPPEVAAQVTEWVT
jgi:putative tryptophan/tyrosine transport system substrate-binding protein